MRPMRLFLLTVKQYLCSPFLLLLLIAAPVLCFYVSHRPATEADDRIRVGYCIVDPDAQNQIGETNEDISWLTDVLADGETLFSFYQSSSPDALRAEVARGTAECGYLIPSDLFEQLRSGNRRELITLLTSPRTTMSDVINETLFANIFQRLSGQVFLRYLTKKSAVAEYYPKAFTDQDVEELYQKYLTNGSTFSFTYDNTVNEFHYGTTAVLTQPLRGLFAVLILLCGFVGALSYYQAAEHPVFARVSVRVVRIVVPMLFACILSLVCLFGMPGVPGIDHSLTGLLLESSRLLLYALICLVFLFLITTLIPYRGILYALFPLYLMGCLIFSPIFLDAAQFLPQLKTISYFFLPTWYLL